MNKKHSRTWRLAVMSVTVLSVLSGCASNQAFYEDQRALEPVAWSAEMPQLSTPLETMQAWWDAWEDTQLQYLLNAAMEANTDILTAQANLRAAAALADDATAKLFPTLNFGASANSQRRNNETTESYSVQGDAVWTISLAGGNIAAQRAANHEALASMLTLEDAKIMVASEVAQNYINLALAYVKRQLAMDTYKNYSQAAEIAQWRYEAGLADRTELDQAVSNREGARAQVPMMTQAIEQYRNALMRLTSLTGDRLSISEKTEIPAAPMQIAVTIPAEMLKQRPDMRSAEFSLIAASERVYEARAQWAPMLNISGSLGTTAATIGALGASGTGVGALIGALSMPLLNWGQQVTASEQALADLDRARATYTATLLTALEETENALTGITTAQKRQMSLKLAWESANSAAESALQQYMAGLTDYQTVLNTQRTLNTARQDMLSNEADLATQLIRLYQAMGGGWQISDDMQMQLSDHDHSIG